MDENIQRVLQDALTPTRAAELAKVDRATVYRWIQAGYLPTYRDTAGRMVVMRSDLEAAVNRAAMARATQFARSVSELPKVLDRMREHETHDPHRRHHRG